MPRTLEPLGQPVAQAQDVGATPGEQLGAVPDVEARAAHDVGHERVAGDQARSTGWSSTNAGLRFAMPLR
jgi:hypothetical protein